MFKLDICTYFNIYIFLDLVYFQVNCEKTESEPRFLRIFHQKKYLYTKRTNMNKTIFDT